MVDEPPFPALVPLPKRIVLLHTQGNLAGLWRIVGTDEEFPEMPMQVDGVDFIDHEGSCSFFRMRPRYILYREVEPVDDLPMHEAQQ